MTAGISDLILLISKKISRQLMVICFETEYLMIIKYETQDEMILLYVPTI